MDKVFRRILPILIVVLVILIPLSYKYNVDLSNLIDSNNLVLKNEATNDELEPIEIVDSGIENIKLNVSMFIPNGQYEIKSNYSDLTFDISYIKGDGTAFEEIGENEKVPMINVYRNIDNGLYQVYSGELSNSEINDKENLNYLDIIDEKNKVLILTEPLQVGTRWGNKEIVEIGQDLKLDDITLEGSYVKIWEKENRENEEIIRVYYYSEGLGCVKYKVLVNGEESEFFSVVSINNK